MTKLKLKIVRSTNPVGRPSKMTPDVVSKLEAAFLLGCTDAEACFSAGISRNTMHNYQTENPEFRDRKQTLKCNPVLQARRVIMDSLMAGDVATANRVIDRAEGRKTAAFQRHQSMVSVTILPAITGVRNAARDTRTDKQGACR
jgi:hypothetical protein